MITNKTTVKDDQVLDAKTGASLLSCFGNRKRAIQVSEILNAHLDEEEAGAIEMDSDKDAEEFLNNSPEKEPASKQVRKSRYKKKS